MAFIFPLTQDYLKEVESLAAACFEKVWRPVDFQFFLKHGGSYCLGYASKEGGAIEAYLLALLIQGELDIISVATDPKSRRSGNAEKLLRHCLKDPGIEKMLLEVDVGNVPAIALYKKLGFQIRNTRKNYYEGKHDAYLMTLEI